MIRIFNWQNRQCITVLTGHNHYVMSARFHPKEDLVVSASLDQTVRVWDISSLRSQQTSAPQRAPEQESAAAASLRLAQQELFGGGGGSLKFPPLEGHERGVNWAAFHPTLQLIVSAADDRTVKLWRMNDTKAWEVDTLRGHFNNVSCVLFHPRQDLILSNSEDKTVRVWDMAKRTCLHTFRREHDRFWIIAAHPEQNVFAAGHDSGVLVFKLERERPAYALHKGKRQAVLFVIKDRHLRSLDLETGKDTPLLAVRKPSTSWHCVAVAYNSSENAVLLQSRTEEGGSYELYKLPTTSVVSQSADETAQCKRGLGSDAVWVGRNKFAVLERGGALVVRTSENEVVKRYNAPPGTLGLLAASSGRVICRTDEGAVLLDFSRPTGEEAIAKVNQAHCRSAVWGGRKEAPVVALLGKHSIVLCTRELQQLCSVQETVKVKSAAWDESSGMLVYTTVNHIKYLLPNGDAGIVRTLDSTMYLVHVKGNRCHLLDRECKLKTLAVDITECYFKMALFNQSFDTVLRMVREANLIGNSIVGYLQKKGHPDVALHFVKDPQVRFNLALQCGELDVALAAARQLEDKTAWASLAQAALAVGDYATAELGLTRSGDTAALATLALCAGRRGVLGRLATSTAASGDVMATFHSNVLRGDVAGMASQLERAQLSQLAFVCYASHGLSDDAARLAAQLQERNIPLPVRPVPPELAKAPNVAPVLVEAEPGFVWPKLAGGPRSALDAALASQKSAGLLAAAEAAGGGAGGEDMGDWGGDDLVLPGSERPATSLLDDDGLGGEKVAVGEEEGGGWGDLDLDSVLVPGPEEKAASASKGGASSSKDFFVAPPPGESKPASWVRLSRLPCDAAAAGDWTALRDQLASQVGVTNIAPLKPYALAVYRGARLTVDGVSAIPGFTPPLVTYLLRGTDGKLPLICITLASLVPQLQEAYAAMSAGKFSTAKTLFLSLMHALLFIVVDTRDGEAEALELLAICREYLTGILLETTRKEEKDGSRAACLAAYFSHCKLQPKHTVFVLRTAMKASLDIKNYLTASSFARRILDLAPSGQFADAAKQVVQFSEKTPSDAVKLAYDERNPFVTCCESLTPIYKGTESTSCPYCKAKYKVEYKNKNLICKICQIATVGGTGTGMVISNFK